MPLSTERGQETATNLLHISHAELFSFHQSHFSGDAVAKFGLGFFPPSTDVDNVLTGEGETWEDDDDGLGYYEDGVKRTLTDEQIEIFRHSEIREMKKQEERARALSAKRDTHVGLTDNVQAARSHRAAEDTSPGATRVSKKKKGKKGAKRAVQEPKPDLRKRTWDVVEAGLDSLEYD